jgi:DNA-binding NarL/FixJ family response regulator
MNTLNPPALSNLSKRQQEILQASCVGTPDKVIAEQLGVSPRTLEGHWRAIHYKLGTTTVVRRVFYLLPCGKTRMGKSSRNFPLWRGVGDGG